IEQYFERLLAITGELKRVLKPTGTLWWNHGDTYSRGALASFVVNEDRLYGACGTRKQGGSTGFPEKCLALQNFRLALRMIEEQSWILRNFIVWHKANLLPNPVQDRFQVDFEPMFFFTKSRRYYFQRQFEPMKPETYEQGIRIARTHGYDRRMTYEEWCF